MKWVDIISYDGNKDVATTVARCVLADGRVHCEGRPQLVARLEAGVLAPDGTAATPADGEKFLEALEGEFHSAYLFATGVREGDKPEDFALPPMKNVEPKQEK